MVTHSGARPRVWVVDDDSFMRAMLSEAVCAAGFAAEVLSGGRELLQRFPQAPPELVVLDVQMPEIDGFEACARLRRLPGGEQVPVLMVTASEDVASIHGAYEAGATDFMAKPVNPVVLGYRLRYLLRSAEAARGLLTSQARLARVQAMAGLAAWDADRGRQLLLCSEEACRLLSLPGGAGSYSLDEVLGQVVAADREAARYVLTRVLSGAGDEPLQFRVPLTTGAERVLHARWEGAGEPAGVVNGTLQDVTELQSAKARVHYLASYDELTGLANRSLFLDRVAEAVAAAERHGRQGALIYVDINQFKRINDTLGHGQGDLLLKGVAERMRSCLRRSDIVARPGEQSQGNLARVGGDEFAILLPELRRVEDAAAITRRMAEAVAEPFELAGRQVVLVLRFGVSVFPGDGVEPGILLQHAYTAVNHAVPGETHCRFYEAAMTEAAVTRLALEQDLRRGLAAEQFRLHYQPLVDLRSGTIVGAEALVRWQHPERGMVSPAEFIPVAEDSGTIVPLGQWVLRTACRQAKAWEIAGQPLRVSVNISPRQFHLDRVCDLVGEALAETGLPGSRLEIEITEGVLLDQSERAGCTLARLKALGVRVAVDDFGTGYSSLSYLQAFPVDTLKIDRSFVSNGDTATNGRAITRAIVALGHSLELNVLAEGVEEREQHEFLCGLGVQEAQGYYFSRPVPAAEFSALLARPLPGLTRAASD